jgi:zinc protease
LYEPRWDEKEFPLLKSQTGENLKRMEAMPAAIASNVFSKLLYGKDCILASIAMGSVKSIESISMDDLKNYYEKNFSPSVARIMVVGDITREKALESFNIFKDWPAKKVKIPEIIIAAAAKPGVYFVDVPKATITVSGRASGGGLQ